MKNKDEIHQRLDEICEKGEEIAGKISQLNVQDLEKKLKIMEELEINLNELLGHIKDWNETKKAEENKP